MEEPAQIHEHALSNLRYIRDAMERATAFTSIPGWGGLWLGISAIATSVVAHGLDGQRWLFVWLADAVVAGIIAAIFMWRKARRAHVSFNSAPARRFFVSYAAPLVAGAALTVALARAGRYDLLPATWLLLYGASFISSGAFSIRVVQVMGACFMTLGIAACVVPFAIGNVLLGVGFGGLHVVFGLIIARSYGG